jgi:hypothetical protein
MTQEKDKKVDVTVVVSGQGHAVTVNPNQTLEHLVKEALKVSGNQGQAPGGWELRTEEGALLDQNSSVSDAGVSDNMTLYLNPHAGAGG